MSPTANERADSVPGSDPDAVPGGIVETDSSPILRAWKGAGLGGVVSASVWAAVSAIFGVEVGIFATLAGICTGVGVAVASRGERGIPFRAIAVVGSLLSILVGKYASYWFVVRRSVLEQLGPGALTAQSPWAPGYVSSFVSNWRASFAEVDALWIALAVVAAWRGADLAAREVLSRRKRAMAALR